MTQHPNPSSSPPNPAPAAHDIRPAKIPAELALRAPRPLGVRLRLAVVLGLGASAAALLAGAFAWAFVVSPELRGEARSRQSRSTESASDRVRPSEAITDGPGGYGDPRLLPPPRGETRPGVEDTLPDTDPPASMRPPGPRPARAHSQVPGMDYGSGRRSDAGRAPDAAQAALGSDLFFDRPAGGRANPRSAAPDNGGPSGPEGPGAPARDRGSGLVGPASPFELKAGELIEAVLLTGVETGRPGPVTAVVSRDVFDTVTGRLRLIPQGARLIGRQEGDSRHGERRAYLVWTRLILPDGSSIALDDAPGVDPQGVVGVEGRADRRLGALIGGALFGGAFTALGSLARSDGGVDRSGRVLDAAGDAAALQGAQSGARLLDRELQVRPSVRLAPGTAVRVLLTRDLVLEPRS